MSETDSKALLIPVLLVSTLLGGVGQLLFKFSLPSSGVVPLYLTLGVLAYAISTLLYLYILGRTHLSWAYGFGGLSYIFASLLALMVLNEPVSPFRWLGIVVIALGTALIGLS